MALYTNFGLHLRFINDGISADIPLLKLSFRKIHFVITLDRYEFWLTICDFFYYDLRGTKILKMVSFARTWGQTATFFTNINGTH